MWITLAFILLPLLLVASATSTYLRRVRRRLDALESKGVSVEPATPEEFDAAWQRVSDIAAFASARGLDFDGAYALIVPGSPRAIFLAWRSDSASPLLLATFVGLRPMVDLVTFCSEDVQLMTSQASHNLLLPREPDRLLQVFPAAPLEKFWDAHVKAVEKLTTRAGLRAVPADPDIAHAALAGGRRHVAYVRSLSMLAVRTAWAMWTSNSRLNKPARTARLASALPKWPSPRPWALSPEPRT